jgi:hypothetical protein
VWAVARLRNSQPSQKSFVFLAQLHLPPLQTVAGRLVILFQRVHHEGVDDQLPTHSLLLGEGHGAVLCRAHLLVSRPSHHDGRRELAAVHRVSRRRFLAHDREHKASADSHVDELTAFWRQQHHALEPTISL